jgi:uncharacterized membrane protein HdeD (DUF308 family)
MKAEEWRRALECFEEVQRLQPGHRDTEELLSRVHRELAQPPTVNVPDLAGQRAPQARSRLANEGLRLGAQNKSANGTVPEGQIIEQSPEAGTEVEEGSSVSVTVSSGPHKAIVTAPSGDQAEKHTQRTERAQPRPTALARNRWAVVLKGLVGDQAEEHTHRAQRTQSLLPALAGSWWAMALRGLLMIVFGLALFGGMPRPLRLWSALMVITDGVIAAIDATTSDIRRRPLLIQGKISGLVGLLILAVWLIVDVLAEGFPSALPEKRLETLLDYWLPVSYLLGSWAIFIGIIRIIAAIQLRWETKNLWLMGASGVSLTFFGILLWSRITLIDLDWVNLFAFLMLLSGIALIAVALRVRDR